MSTYNIFFSWTNKKQEKYLETSPIQTLRYLCKQCGLNFLCEQCGLSFLCEQCAFKCLVILGLAVSKDWRKLFVLSVLLMVSCFITKARLYKSHFYTVKLGFTGVHIIFLILLKNIDCGYSLEPPHWGSSYENLQSMFWAEIWKISDFFNLEIFFFWS